VPHPEAQPGRDLPGVEVLTLPEAAAFLRASEEAVMELVDTGALPAQRIGGEWRFLKRALVELLRFGPHHSREFRMFPPPWVFEHPFWEEMLWALEQRILSKLPTSGRPSAKPGSKQAVLRHFGVFKDDADVEEQLAGIRTRREAAGE
jgi:excisionase family DNA binding protein